MMDKGRENRRHKRLRVNLSVVYRIDRPAKVRLTIGNKDTRATMLDLSEGGISFLTGLDIPRGSLLQIKFTLFTLEKDDVSFYGPIEITGEVRYNMPLSGSEYRIGILFKQLDEDDKREILSFIKRTSGS